MKKNYLKSVLASALLPFALMSLSSCNGDYYARANGKEGEELKSILREIIDHKTPIEYDDLWPYYPTTDYVEGEGNEKRVTLFYTGEVVSTYILDEDYAPSGGTEAKGTINREHVWPESRFKIYGTTKMGNNENPGPGTDLYNVRPCWGDLNGYRSNYFFGEHANTADVDRVFDPVHDAELGKAEFRGEIARILFYDATRYEKLTLIDEYSGGTGNDSHEMGKLSDLLKWHLENPVNGREKHRNDVIQEIQGNRNPYVDHPEYACKIWGNYNDATKSICGLK